MAKSNQQINKEMSNGTTAVTTLAVVDYRMGQLETAVRDGFDKHDKKLDSLTNGFATKAELLTIQRQLDSWRWYFRALIVAVFTALGTSIGAFIMRVK